MAIDKHVFNYIDFVSWSIICVRYGACNKLRKLYFRQADSIFYVLSWKHLAGFNYMVESLMSHEVFAEEGRCIPFTLDPEHKKKAIALHDDNYTEQACCHHQETDRGYMRCAPSSVYSNGIY